MVEQKSKTFGRNTQLKRQKVVSPEKKRFHICQDPLYRALVTLGLGHKIQINVMSTLGMEELNVAFLDSFYSTCKGQPTIGWDKWVGYFDARPRKKWLNYISNLFHFSLFQHEPGSLINLDEWAAYFVAKI